MTMSDFALWRGGLELRMCVVARSLTTPLSPSRRRRGMCCVPVSHIRSVVKRTPIRCGRISFAINCVFRRASSGRACSRVSFPIAARLRSRMPLCLWRSSRAWCVSVACRVRRLRGSASRRRGGCWTSLKGRSRLTRQLQPRAHLVLESSLHTTRVDRDRVARFQRSPDCQLTFAAALRGYEQRALA